MNLQKNRSDLSNWHFFVPALFQRHFSGGGGAFAKGCSDCAKQGEWIYVSIYCSAERWPAGHGEMKNMCNKVEVDERNRDTPREFSGLKRERWSHLALQFLQERSSADSHFDMRPISSATKCSHRIPDNWHIWHVLEWFDLSFALFMLIDPNPPERRCTHVHR